MIVWDLREVPKPNPIGQNQPGCGNAVNPGGRRAALVGFLLELGSVRGLGEKTGTQFIHRGLVKQGGGASRQSKGRMLRGGKELTGPQGGVGSDLMGGSQGSRETSLWDRMEEGAISRNMWAQWERVHCLALLRGREPRAL